MKRFHTFFLVGFVCLFGIIASIPCTANGLIPPETMEEISCIHQFNANRDLPAVFDWRQQDGVTAARDQGMVDCFPCWAFCLVAAVESSAKIQLGMDLDLSEQQLLDCNQENYGCDGGWLDGWTILRDYGAVTESCYPYAGIDQPCIQQPCQPVVAVTGCTIVGGDELAIKQALYDHAPVACGMTVYNDFSFYNEGCYSHEGDDMYNHGVVIVGWDDTACDGTGAWIVKNSFGSDWGEEGYIYMEYGTCRIGAGARYFDVSLPAPTPTPTVTPTATPAELTYTLTLADTDLEPGDTFQLVRRCFNPGPTSLTAQEYILLIIGTDLFLLDSSTDQTLPVGLENIWMIFDFVWPDIPSAQLDATLAGCLLDPETVEILVYDLEGVKF